ncbi:hypothetical protein CC86DRAFT_463521 [Ophiobolus disseminans]|uniref:Prion-inhibition and propagation HeLo domain-containing protein n=1 Tax=Ophiobolus disseminans TaxID=1469910 RepID=A0A6A7AG89_9PLEO|nr:hypothetical protein CC86DRAFT_463521 [Ophiobolus disseminans]
MRSQPSCTYYGLLLPSSIVHSPNQYLHSLTSSFNTDPDHQENRFCTLLVSAFLGSHRLRSSPSTMDPASLALGIAGFAFQLFIAAQTGYTIITTAKATSEAASRLKTLMGFEQIKFESWATAVGLTDADTEFEEHLKNDRLMYHVTMQALYHICDIVTKFNELTSKYGFTRNERVRLMAIFQRRNDVHDQDNDSDNDTGIQPITIPHVFNSASRASFEDILHTYQKRLSYMSKFTWVIQDKAKFENLVEQTRAMNSGLQSSLPRTMQALFKREIVAGQPNDLLALQRIETTTVWAEQAIMLTTTMLSYTRELH